MENILHYTTKDQVVHVQLRQNQRAKRLSLRFDCVGNIFNLTVPTRTSQKRINLFLNDCESWILKQTSTSMGAVAFKNDSIISVLEKNYTIVHQQFFSRRRAYIEKDSIIVQSTQDRVNEVVVSFLKQHAKLEFTKVCEKYASQIGRAVNKVSVRDTKTKWGSCTKEGNISLCWRLLLAPGFVAEYVCIHEVAHLKEMNHSPDFWKIVENLQPQYNKSRNWLKGNGKELFRYGIASNLHDPSGQ